MDDNKREKWDLMFMIIEENTSTDRDYYEAKNKILTDKYVQVTATEFKSLYEALKRAEHNSYHGGYPTVAYLCRRLGFHSREEGLEEFAYLKDKYGGCYIATMVYGSYNSPEVKVFRRFRDDFLEKRKWGRKFVSIYYKHSPSIVKKLENKEKTNKCIKLIFDKVVLKFVMIVVGDENV